MKNLFKGKGGIEIQIVRKSVEATFKDFLINELNTTKGAYFCSSFEYPGRYTRWDMGFVNPPVEIKTYRDRFEINALNEKGELLLDYIYSFIEWESYTEGINREKNKINGKITKMEEVFSEEERSRQVSVFSLIRTLREAFYTEEDRFLGLYGAFGYDLIFQFESIPLSRERDINQPDMVLYIPDEIFIVDHQKNERYLLRYNFKFEGKTTEGKDRSTADSPKNKINVKRDIPEYKRGDYSKKVQYAKEYFARGDLFEVVPSHEFHRNCTKTLSELFNQLVTINPSPYGFLINLGDEALIGASPEMYVRVEGKRIETCPISGTIKRGKNPIEDSERIRELLNSHKDETELTMCTDVDRNDKSRICVPGSVKVIGRRQIEMYSHLIHTVDHVEGILKEELDSLDAFMTHMWAVTVTGAPKKAAIEWIEENEASNRDWYGGAVGFIGFDGNINTGLTLRTIRIKSNIASIRVGATVLYDSNPEAEEEETIVKAAALMKVLKDEKVDTKEEEIFIDRKEDNEKRLEVLFIDHEDSFLHTLGSYFRQAGCGVKTLRHTIAKEAIKAGKYDLVVLSPGPGTPSDYRISEAIKLCEEMKIPVFGVCLGLQGIVEYYGGDLGCLDYPVHGKQSELTIASHSVIFDNIEKIKVGRYHSLYASYVPHNLEVTAKTNDGIVMAVEDKKKMMFGVQFHPESIMSMEDDKGYKIIQNLLNTIKGVQ
ncbi:anthranilate synthase component I [Alkaliphilus peptidifermentans]|uniref:Anthranilate synthase n=1 Tax=Alkaliphilus peptidifermentans DSM 18978 TaxID=1120976 RepID=A0A1G5JQL4_9FIRM|nr:anthranilate synthase component I [Alkaliphilus peptidifermentans]SCY90434.1 anthranilate synthase, component I [Alkaliphilus peptidifermentans DSM 18978]